MFKFLSSFYSKLAISLLVCFAVIGVVLTLMVQMLTQKYQHEVEQKLHSQLALHIVKENQLFNDNEIDHKAIKHAFHGMMILGPSFEFYVLDPSGRVLTYSADPDRIKLDTVSLAPIKRFLDGSETFPIFGDDPRSLNKQKIFSVAPIMDGDERKGYLYIIIGGEIYDGINQLLQASHIMQLGFWSVGLILIATLVITLLLFALLTRPLRKLANDMLAYKQNGFENGLLPKTQWKKDSSDEFDVLGNQFNELTEALNEQYQKVKNTDELRRELISYVSHDLRTPLASLQGYLETWLLKFPDNEEGKALIAVAMNNAAKMSRLIEQLFELAHLDGENVSLNLEPVCISELAFDVLRARTLELEQSGLTMDVHPKDSSLFVNGDYEKLERVLSNLVDNAIRHSESGASIKIEITEFDAQNLEICVVDTGIGIPEKDLPHIFDSHFRAENSKQGTGENSGLGLAICKRIVELHGSRLMVSSTLGEGTRFCFILPKA